jgi:class 3 adenylate cyclase/tetratricopeptide (TPR) repeat protein
MLATAGSSVDIAAYIPRWVKISVATPDLCGDSAWATPRVAAVLLFDIAGFTKITDRLAQHGERGAEQLSGLLNDCFAILTDVVDAHGGDIISFTGDGFFALWDIADPALASCRAAQCALALRDAMSAWALSSNSQFRQRICVDFGTVYFCKLGGYGNSWRYVVVGTPFHGLGSAYRKAGVGQILLCERAWQPIVEHCDGEVIRDVLELRRLKNAPRSSPLAPLPETDAFSYRSLVPAVVFERLSIGAQKWLAEFRKLSVLYVSFPSVSFDDPACALQPCISTLQRVAHRLEGVILGVWMDDKGICAAALFGAPPFAREEYALRAVRAGLCIQEDLAHYPIRTSIGISSDRFFCGDYGGRSRRDYGAFGPAVTTAARLMGMADGGILCDASTAQAVDGQVSFVVLEARQIKGRAAPIALYRPTETLPTRPAFPNGEIVGREHERRQLRARLAHVKAGVGGVVIVGGEPGIGKSRLLSDLADAAKEDGVAHVRGYASAIDRMTPYFAWRPVLLALLEPYLNVGVEPLEAALAVRLRHEPGLIPWLPLLRDILPVTLDETALTTQITGAARAASIEAIVLALIRHAPKSPRILIFEDLHWFDEASLGLLRGVVRQATGVLVVASRRSPDLKAATEFRLSEGQVLEINLDELSADSVAEIIRRRLRATEISPALVGFVRARAGGNPFYCEEFVSALRDAGAITVNQGVGVTTIDAFTSARVQYPDNLESAIVTRIDALRADVQLLLKVASAIGGPFTARVLHGIYPGALSVEAIQVMLNQLVERELLRFQEDGTASHYEFRHAISEDVTYSLLPFVQRRVLHAAIANALEQEHVGRLEPYYGQLARHWEGAQEVPQAIRYLELAAEQAIRSHANHDAIQYIRRAFDLGISVLAGESNERFAKWETILGDAYNELADYHQSLPHYERALLLSGQRVARNSRERGACLIRNLATQGWRRATPSLLVKPMRGDAEASRRAAHIRERLAERHFFRNEPAAVLDETLAAVNLAEGCQAVTEMISGYSALALGLAMSGLRAPARLYQKRAIALAERFEPAPESARAYLLASVLGFGIGDWESAQRYAERSLSMYRRLGDRARALTPLTILASVHVLRGELEQAERFVVESGDLTKFQSTGQGQAWRLTAKVMISAIRGKVDANDVGQLIEAVNADLTQADQLLCLGTAASGFLRRGDMSSALAAADRGLPLLREAGIVWGNYVYGVAGVIEVFLACWAVDVDSPLLTADARNKALLACKYARRAARTSPVCQPPLLLLRGRIALLSGRPRKAQKIWAKAAISAERLQMPREQGMALYEIGRLSRLGDPGRLASLARAAAIFEAIGANADCAAARRAMAFFGAQTIAETA